MPNTSIYRFSNIQYKEYLKNLLGMMKCCGFQKYFLQFFNIKPPKINFPLNATSKYQTYEGGR